MKKLSAYIMLIAVAAMASCTTDLHRNTGRTYAPDMTYSRAVDFYHGTEKIENQGGSYNKMPAPNTIAREQSLPEHIGENDTLLADANKCNMLLTEADVEVGKRLYLIQCGICHGEQLDGNGPLYTSGKFAAMPANLKSGEKYLKMSQGRIYHGIVYGKNAMGSYASQLDTKQRWQIVAYIKKVQSENGGEPFTMIANAATPAVTAAKNETTEPNAAEGAANAK
jgi:cytochrome c553